MLVLHVPDALQHTSTDGVAQILRRRLGMDVAEINRSVYSGTPRYSTRAAGHHGVDVSLREPAGGGRSVAKGGKHGRLWGDKGLCLLRLGDVCTTVFAIVDAFTSPVGFGREGVDDLSKAEQGAIKKGM